MRRAVQTSMLMIGLGALAGCAHPGLPEVEGLESPADVPVAEGEFKPNPSPFARSAFEGVKLDGGGHAGHGGHGGHGGHDMKSKHEGHDMKSKHEGHDMKSKHEGHDMKSKHEGHGDGGQP